MSDGLDRIPASVHAGDGACPPNKPQAYVDKDGAPYTYVVAAGPTSQSLWKAAGDGWAYVDDNTVYNMMGATVAGLLKAAEKGFLTKCSVDAIEFETQRPRPVRHA